MNNRSKPPRPPAAYWWCQAGGWGVFFLFAVFTSKGYTAFSWNTVGGYFLLGSGGFLLTHTLPRILLRHRAIELPLAKLLTPLPGANRLLPTLLVATRWWPLPILPPPRTLPGPCPQRDAGTRMGGVIHEVRSEA